MYIFDAARALTSSFVSVVRLCVRARYTSIRIAFCALQSQIES